jgi:hypothetical protein
MTLWQGCRRRVGLRRRRCSKTRSCHAPSWCGAIVLPTPATGGARTHEHAGAPPAPAWEMQPAKGQQARERASTGPTHACIQAPLRPCMHMHVHVPGKQARIITSTYLKTSTSGAPSKCRLARALTVLPQLVEPSILKTTSTTTSYRNIDSVQLTPPCTFNLLLPRQTHRSRPTRPNDTGGRR